VAVVAYAKKPNITPQEYLERECQAETKSEYYDGVIVPRSGASPEHDRIAVDLLRHLGNQLAGTSCEPFSSDMRVRVPAHNRYFYPDVSVACGGSKFEALSGVRSLLNPRLIIEVLSDSTEKIDRSDKFRCYQTLESLGTYVLIAQDRPQVEVFTRMPEGKWEYVLHAGLEATLTLPSIDCTLKLADVYARVEFLPESEEAVEEGENAARPG
jgi:Uma2 family endonuclease